MSNPGRRVPEDKVAKYKRLARLPRYAKRGTIAPALARECDRIRRARGIPVALYAAIFGHSAKVAAQAEAADVSTATDMEDHIDPPTEIDRYRDLMRNDLAEAQSRQQNRKLRWDAR